MLCSQNQPNGKHHTKPCNLNSIFSRLYCYQIKIKGRIKGKSILTPSVRRRRYPGSSPRARPSACRKRPFRPRAARTSSLPLPGLLSSCLSCVRVISFANFDAIADGWGIIQSRIRTIRQDIHCSKPKQTSFTL